MHISEAKSKFIVFIILQIFPLTAKAAARKQDKTKHEAKHVDFLVLSGTAFSTIFQEIEEKRSISKFLCRTGVIGCERALSAYWVTCHDSTNHARDEIFDGL